MDLGIISTRYANALLLFAEEKGETKQVYQETTTLAHSFLAVPALQQAMTNPVLSVECKSRLLLTAACGEQQPSASLKRFVQLVVNKARADIMLFVAHSYGTLYRKKEHMITARLVVPTAIQPNLKEKLQQMVESRAHCKVDFKVDEDASIEGGFILEYDTYKLDASVRTQLSKIKRELI
ncbi:F0F1 ATP synthase subunit delta [Prevotellamassilia timonensis]|uniref:F0F1 ATP synthase subunit delta n=1 Tax=Prevotellamassilia timonensis TaxID=1852370 RepID=UPI00307C44A8